MTSLRSSSLTALLIASAALSLGLSQPASKPAGATKVVRAARLFDGKSNSLITPGIVVVTGGKVVSAGRGVTVPTDAEVIELGDATILPGFIDAHTHLTYESTDDWKQLELDLLKKPAAERALESIKFVERTLMSGFTTVRDLGSIEFDADELIDLSLRNAIASGAVRGPRLLVALHPIGATGGHCDPTNGFRPGLTVGGQRSSAIANGPEAVRAAVRANLKYGADVVKVCASGGVLSVGDDVGAPQMTQAELDALVDETHALKRTAAAHAHGAEAAKRAVRAGIDSIEHGVFLDEEALDLMKARGTFLVPTLMALEGLHEQLKRGAYFPPVVEAKVRAAIAAEDRSFKMALAKGVRIALGTDAGVFAHGRNAEEFGLMVRFGMRPIDALRAGTSSTAELLGIADQVGTVEVGKSADLVAVPGNPLTDIRVTERAFFVMKEGVTYKLDKRP